MIRMLALGDKCEVRIVKETACYHVEHVISLRLIQVKLVFIAPHRGSDTLMLYCSRISEKKKIYRKLFYYMASDEI